MNKQMNLLAKLELLKRNTVDILNNSTVNSGEAQLKLHYILLQQASILVRFGRVDEASILLSSVSTLPARPAPASPLRSAEKYQQLLTRAKDIKIRILGLKAAKYSQAFRVFNEFVIGTTSVIPIGDFCLAAQLLGDSGIRQLSYPFDWLFLEPSFLTRILKNNFIDFIAKESLIPHGANNGCGHKIYGERFFNHHDPSEGADRKAFKRRIARFKDLYKREDKGKLFFRRSLRNRKTDMLSLLEALPQQSKTISFTFKKSHAEAEDYGVAPKIELLYEDRLLMITFYTYPATTKITNGRQILCPHAGAQVDLTIGILRNHFLCATLCYL